MLYRKILVPMALDHGVSEHTLEVAGAICVDGGEIIGLHVYEAPPGVAASYMDKSFVEEAVASAKIQLAEKTEGLQNVSTDLVVGHTYRSIVDYAVKHGVDCIVMGSHRPGLSDFFLGSTAARVVRHAPCAVHVYRGT
ncbi:universal stress protein [Octadecabacter ascidiaceicola]|uniref:Universal stress protein F n=1 Tax=Octadecabacter ascidiaceicola TaxID=1655543 RepID=A0A238KR85_9RHOB|nr:universal stress protein [Octadecabacter ascidiaceicola]SMX44652.1 Universal stress protein F [Octadecabacter ascidiaceicola]